MDVLVLGGGVSGLCCALRLREAGHAVALWARALSPHTTSDVAAAVWYPYRAAPQERVNAWARRTYDVLGALAREPEAGIVIRPGIELLRAPGAEPWWRPSAPDFRRATPGELPPGFVDGYCFTAPVVQMPRYLRFLRARLEALGGTVHVREAHSLQEALAEAPVVVNCTGLGARELVGDTSLFALRGEVLRVAPPPVERFLMDEDEAHGMAYVIPRLDDCILGGTAEEGRESLEPDMAQAAGILERTARLLPPGVRLEVLEHRVGLRPGRPSVRLELERVGQGWCVHDYGHGGAGVTLSWGCAEEVARLVSGLYRGTA